MLVARARYCALALLLWTGCAPYVSTYRAPLDGRARAVWDAEGALVVDPGGLVLTPECGAAIRALTGRETMPTAQGTIELPTYGAPTPTPVPGQWSPVYYGSQASSSFATSGGARPVYFWIPGLSWSGGGGANGYGAIRVASFGRSLSVRGGSSGSGGGGGGGGGGGDGRGAVIAAVLAAIALPIVDIALAWAPPTSQPRSATVTDVVAAWNDLARTPGSPCEMPGGATPIPSAITEAATGTGAP